MSQRYTKNNIWHLLILILSCIAVLSAFYMYYLIYSSNSL